MAVLQLPEEDELLWDDGSAYPEYCLDRFELVSKVRAPHFRASSKHQGHLLWLVPYCQQGKRGAHSTVWGSCELVSHVGQPAVHLSSLLCI